MNAKYLLSVICFAPCVCSAAIPYRAQQAAAPAIVADIDENQAFAAHHRFYAGAMYNFSMWQNATDGDVHTGGKNTSSVEGVLGVRVSDTFRIEANYLRTDADWNAFSLTGDTVFLNAIVDARIDSLYRLFYRQRLIPYVGAGAGMSWNSSDDVKIDDSASPVLAALAGIGIEMGEYFTVDLGYRYFYMFRPKFDIMPDFAPAAHQFRAGVRINF